MAISNKPQAFAQHSMHFILLGIVLSALLCVSTCLADITINHVNRELQQQSSVLNADVNYQLSEKVLEALENGVPLTFRLEMLIQKPREYLWNEDIAESVYRYQLQYHALSEKYIVKDLQSQQQKSYPSMRAALVALGRVKGVPLPLQKLPNDSANYILNLKVQLEISSLPAPMRPLAWLTTDWHLESDWFQWPLQP